MAFCSQNYLHRCKITFWLITGRDNFLKKSLALSACPCWSFYRETQSCRPTWKPHFHWHLLLNVACPGTVILNPLAWWVILLAAGYQTAHLLHPVIMKGFLENGCLWLFTTSLQAPFSKKILHYYYSQYTTCFRTINVFNKFWFHH